MTPEKQSLAIAKLIGINVKPCTCKANPWRDADKNEHLPDFTSDLNAMARAEEWLITTHTTLFSLYCEYLHRWARSIQGLKGRKEWILVRASAKLKSECFLRALGAFKEEGNE